MMNARNNPDSQANQNAHTQNRREAFALKMMTGAINDEAHEEDLRRRLAKYAADLEQEANARAVTDKTAEI